MWLTRQSVFDYENNFYYKPNGTINTSSANDPNALPNCTKYCFQRMHEASDQTSKQNYWIRDVGGFGNAKTWYDTTNLPKGLEPKEGAIVVYDGKDGHVAYIEKMIDATHGNLTESNFSTNKNLRDWHFFNKRDGVELIAGTSSLPGTGKLIGFIYVPINDIRTARDTTKHQIQVLGTSVNVRTAADGELYQKGLFCPMGIFNVKSTSTDTKGRTWFELEENRWICGGEWLVEYKAEKPSKVDYELKYKELEAKVKEVIKTLQSAIK